jgi:PmbA protein
MLGREKVKAIVDQVMAASKADQTEMVVSGEDSFLTRFANSTIHQNVAETNVEISVRAVVGKKIGVASTNRIDKAALRGVTERALEIARLQKENPDFLSLPEPKPVVDMENLSKGTVDFSPQQRADAVKRVIAIADKSDVQAFGSFSTGTAEVAVANSLGVFCHNLASDAHLVAVAMGESGSGYALSSSRDAEQIGVEGTAQRAVDKAVRSAQPTKLEPGEYMTILEELAVRDLIEFMAYLGLGALPVQEGRSFACGKFGQRIVSDAVTIVDDSFDSRGFTFPYDFEGVPKQRVPLIEAGVLKGVVYDSLTAGKEGKESTGHALPAPNTYGPVPLNLVMEGGDSSMEEMIASTDRGILVTRFHYTNVVEPMKVILTGMTRDGTFLIDGGKIVRAVNNFRFTQSVLAALSNVVQITSVPITVGSPDRYGPRFGQGSVMPAIKVSAFNFSGVTEF